jgi:hypothetical protein
VRSFEGSLVAVTLVLPAITKLGEAPALPTKPGAGQPSPSTLEVSRHWMWTQSACS